MQPAAVKPGLVYFHGMPGGPGEWEAMALPALRARAFVPDRNAATTPEDLSGQIAAACNDGQLTLIAFSLGVPVALAVAELLGPRIGRLHLVSPAGPLQLGHFLDQMAGAPLFGMATARPAMFRHVVRLESVAARIAPAFLFRQLMASAQGQDRALRDDPRFAKAMAEVLRKGLGRDWRGFDREVTAYVADWSALPARITAPAMLWQGDADNWTPPAMAAALAAALGGKTELLSLPGASHYSALKRALAEIRA